MTMFHLNVNRTLGNCFIIVEKLGVLGLFK